jgi:hypothetical protein
MLSNGVFVDSAYQGVFEAAGLTNMDSIFAFSGGETLSKENLSRHRSRIRFEVDHPSAVLYLKRYDRTPIRHQLKSWFETGRRISTACRDRLPCEDLGAAGIRTPQVVAFGFEWGTIFERRSFIITRMLEDAEALERRLPTAFGPENVSVGFSERKAFLARLAEWVRRFHATGYCHRDLYLAHVFQDMAGDFYLIDLQRAFRPRLWIWRYRIKDLAELHYSAPGDRFSCSDRVRFYRYYIGHKRLTRMDRWRISQIRARAWRMADHDIRHGRPVPFAR